MYSSWQNGCKGACNHNSVVYVSSPAREHHPYLETSKLGEHELMTWESYQEEEGKLWKKVSDLFSREIT